MSEHITWAQLTTGQQEYLNTLGNAGGEWVSMDRGNSHYFDSVVLCGMGLAQADDRETHDRITPAGIAVWKQRGNATSSLPALWKSTSDLYARFDLRPTESATLDKFREEVDEFIKASIYDTDGGAHMVEEAGDVFVTVIGMLIARGVSLELLQERVAYVIAKNDAKTTETHYVNEAGLIARRGNG